jgi:hypothetical protein
LLVGIAMSTLCDNCTYYKNMVSSITLVTNH